MFMFVTIVIQSLSWLNYFYTHFRGSNKSRVIVMCFEQGLPTAAREVDSG